ncbi:isoaspartyl peptidase/L-asparaginase [Flavobacterium amniphilum]|uniref:isoaspartyl peptidase/L-asparaginase family protein n=1 Tax=Flavobacterium amniphilum TaxID=1834035 RepID=UPI002029B6DE|nr:isoaspartyl peptidase/L-asparaginase [Flavobacterium amniphilum]MCL9804399.1 isoaspartyl peptidase/L-asparaginase [Flavobacterium amniphilum]
MNKIILLLITLLLLNCKSEQLKGEENNFAIAIHGGAGTILKQNMTPEQESEYRNTLEKAIRTGHDVLKNGGTSLEAVQKAIIVMEDSPLFNAGKGAVFTNEGKNELDASIMDGKTLKAGAVAGVTVVKNPIVLAYTIMEKSPHVMLTNKGAEAFAKEQGLEIVDPSYFYTEKAFKALEKVKNKEKEKDSKFGTVGCVALDKYGNLAAGTSTGGMTNKKWNRVGDSPIIGAGTYANNKTCAVSSTGWGEFFIRATVAHDISAMMEYKKLKVNQATKEAINKVANLGGDGGVIAIDKKGNISFDFNTAGMYRASIDKSGKLYIGMYKE